MRQAIIKHNQTASRELWYYCVGTPYWDNYITLLPMLLQNPKLLLSKLCKAIDLPFDDAMLNWPAGGHKSDGVWAKHWYGSVWKSTQFSGEEAPLPVLSNKMFELCQKALPFYEKLRQHSL